MSLLSSSSPNEPTTVPAQPAHSSLDKQQQQLKQQSQPSAQVSRFQPERGALSQRISSLHSHVSSISPSQNGELLKWKRATAPHSNQIDEAEGSDAGAQDSPR